MAEVMREVASWPRAHQKKLAAYLLHLRTGTDVAWRKEMARRIDDKNPSNWVSLEQFKKSIRQRANK